MPFFLFIFVKTRLLKLNIEVTLNNCLYSYSKKIHNNNQPCGSNYTLVLYWLPVVLGVQPLQSNIRTGYVCVLSHSVISDSFAALWTVACQVPLSMGFSRKDYWSGLSFPPPRDLPNPGIELMPQWSPALPGGFFTTESPGEQNWG